MITAQISRIFYPFIIVIINVFSKSSREGKVSAKAHLVIQTLSSSDLERAE